MSKAKKWFKPMFELDDNIEPQAKNNFTNISVKYANDTDEKVNEKTENINNNAHLMNDKNWIRNFDPKTIEDLAVNSKKVQEVELWLTNMCQNNCGEILLLSGPVGCGKTASVNVIAQKHKIKITEWITPLDIDIPTDYGDYEYREKQSTKFLDFIINVANFTSLLDNNRKKAVLVEDMPNTFIRTPSEFSLVLQQFKDRAKSPMIFICSDNHTDNKNTALNLFTNKLKEQFKIQHVTFNGVAPTVLKTALKRISGIISIKYSSFYNTPSPDLIECVANSSVGDVRSAMLNLHFACLKGSKYNLDTSVTEKNEKRTKTTRKRKQIPKFNSIGKDSTVTILHAVGKVLNPKRTEDGKKLTNQPIEVTEQFMGQSNSFVNFLYENYLTYFSNIEETEVAAADLSLADFILSDWEDKYSQEYGLYVAIAGMMLANKHPVTAWNPVRGPRNMKIKYPTTSEIPLIERNTLCKGKILASDYQTYCKIIAEKQGNTSVNNNITFSD